MHEKRRRSKSRFALSTIAVIAALAVSACSSSAEPNGEAAEETHEVLDLRVGVLPFATVSAFHLASDQGRFEEAGLNIETNQATSGSAHVAALVAGDLDIAYANFVTAFQAAERGLPIQIFLVNDLGSTGKGLGNGLMVMPDSPVEDAAGLEGKKIAINAVGAIQEMTTVAALEEAGLERGDYELVEIPPANMLAALEEGQVDAAWLGDPFLTIGIQESGLRQVVPAFSGRTEGIPQSGWITTKQFAAEHEEELTRFMTVMEEVLAESVADEDQSEIREVIPKISDISPELAANLNWIDFDPNNDLDGLTRLQDEMVRYGIIQTPVNLDDIVLKL